MKFKSKEDGGMKEKKKKQAVVVRITLSSGRVTAMGKRTIGTPATSCVCDIAGAIEREKRRRSSSERRRQKSYLLSWKQLPHLIKASS